MSDDDPLTPGEIRRAFVRIEREDQARDARIVSLAAEMVPVKLWEAEHRALTDRVAQDKAVSDADRARIERNLNEATRRHDVDITAVRSALEHEVEELRDEIKAVRDDHSKRAEVTWQKVIGLIAALAAVATVIVAVLGQSKGIR